MTENIISIIFINPCFVNPKINNFHSFFLEKCRSDAVSRDVHGRICCAWIFDFPQFIHTVRHTRTNTSSIFMLSTRYIVTIINIIHNLWITLWITFNFAVYKMWAFPIFPVFTPCIVCIEVFQILHILIFYAVCPHFYQHRIPCYPQNIPNFVNRKIFYTFCG